LKCLVMTDSLPLPLSFPQSRPFLTNKNTVMVDCENFQFA
jgi:hypothetical protein